MQLVLEKKSYLLDQYLLIQSLLCTKKEVSKSLNLPKIDKKKVAVHLIEKIFKLLFIRKIKRTIAIGVRSNVSISKPISEETFTFFLIKPYKLNVRATVIPIQGTSPSLIRK